MRFIQIGVIQIGVNVVKRIAEKSSNLLVCERTLEALLLYIDFCTVK